MTQVVLPNATEAELEELITPGDAAFDTTNRAVRVGDGVTRGGIVLASAEQVAAQVTAALVAPISEAHDAVAASQAAAQQAHDTVGAVQPSIDTLEDEASSLIARATAIEEHAAGLDGRASTLEQHAATVDTHLGTLDGRASATEASVAGLGVTSSAWPRGKHSYWAIRVNASTAGFDLIQITTLEFRATPGGADQCGGGAPVCSSQDANYPASAAFDGSPDSETTFTANLPQYLGYHFAAAVSVNEVMIRAKTGDRPSAFDVQFSDDGVTWTTAWTPPSQTDVAGATRVNVVYTDPLYGQYAKKAVLTPPVDGQLYALRGSGAPDSWEPVPVAPPPAAPTISANLALLRAASQRGFFPAPLALAEPGITVTYYDDSNNQQLPARPGTTSLYPSDRRISMEGGVVTTSGAPGNFDDHWFLCRSAHPTTDPSPSRDAGKWASGGYTSLEFYFAGTDLWFDMLNLALTGVHRIIVDGVTAWNATLTQQATIRLHVQFASAKLRLVRFEHHCQYVLGITTPTPNLITAAPAKPVVPWMGDSFIGGSATQAGDDPDDGYSVLSHDAGRALGWNLYNSGLGGTGLIHAGGTICYMDRLEDLTLEGLGGPTPSAAVLWMSDNDNNATPAEQARFSPSATETNRYAALYSADRNTPALQTEFGQLTANAVEIALHQAIRHWLNVVGDGPPLIIIGPWSNSGLQSARPLPIVTYQVRDAAARTARCYRSRNVHFIDQLVPDLFAGDLTDPTTMAHYYTRGDSVHPNVHGGVFRGLNLAQRIEAVLFGTAR